METGEILLLATVALILLGGIVSLGIGHRRWSIGTVVAGFLVLLAAAAYLYLAARLADRDRAWARKFDDYLIRFAKARDDQAPDAEGRLVPPGGGPQSLDRLREERDRWRRGLDRVDTWRGRSWAGASFQPPKDDGATGRIELPAELNAEDSPPIAPGAHVFLFDTMPYEDGGAYIGEFLVEETSYDQASKRHSLTVVQTAPRDDYDTKILGRPHDSVIVFDDLPVDRWLAFYRSRGRTGDTAMAASLPEPVKEDAAGVRELLESSPDVGLLVERFVEAFTQHEEDVPRDDWESAAAEARENPGTLWADVEFTKPHSFAAAGAAPDAEAADGPKQDFEPGERTEFDLQTAIDLRDGHDAVTIARIFRRRPLTDALTLLHGSKPAAGADEGLRVDGTAMLRRRLEDELAALEKSNKQLHDSEADATASTADQQNVAEELRRDLEAWRRDVQAATDLAAGIERELGSTARSLRAAEAAIVDQGRTLTATITRLAREIDRAAPPPERRAAKP